MKGRVCLIRTCHVRVGMCVVQKNNVTGEEKKPACFHAISGWVGLDCGFRIDSAHNTEEETERMPWMESVDSVTIGTESVVTMTLAGDRGWIMEGGSECEHTG